MLVIEIFFTFFNTALSQSSIVAQYHYPKKNMIKFSHQPVTKQQKIVFPPTIWIWSVIRSNLLSLIKFSRLYNDNVNVVLCIRLYINKICIFLFLFSFQSSRKSRKKSKDDDQLGGFFLASRSMHFIPVYFWSRARWFFFYLLFCSSIPQFFIFSTEILARIPYSNMKICFFLWILGRSFIICIKCWIWTFYMFVIFSSCSFVFVLLFLNF